MEVNAFVVEKRAGKAISDGRRVTQMHHCGQIWLRAACKKKKGWSFPWMRPAENVVSLGKVLLSRSGGGGGGGIGAGRCNWGEKKPSPLFSGGCVGEGQGRSFHFNRFGGRSPVVAFSFGGLFGGSGED